MANKKIRAAVISYGNIGKAVVQALNAAPDFEIAGVVRRSVANIPAELQGIEVVDSIKKLSNVDVAVICAPTRQCPEYAKQCLDLGISTVDSFDIHTRIPEVYAELDAYAKKSNAASIISAGWDPGSDSMVRALLLAMAPKGITYTNFGPGRSMGHTVCVKSKKGVKDALSITIPLGTSIHRRMVYVELEDGYKLEDVAKDIKADDYFAHDETHVIQVDSVDALNDVGHGVNLVRKGVSGETQNQNFEFNMSINNPALTGQILVASARAVLKKQPGCYTMIEIAPIDLLPGDKMDLIKSLV
ncbi:MAG: diaminopimelate dehydrogenase [Bacteroidales bacterium]|jgi:diaminopimelate dehydrogenase|nr:diaminopimelate dehydrogenase [Bacteroidales bacterium]